MFRAVSSSTSSATVRSRLCARSIVDRTIIASSGVVTRFLTSPVGQRVTVKHRLRSRYQASARSPPNRRTIRSSSIRAAWSSSAQGDFRGGRRRRAARASSSTASRNAVCSAAVSRTRPSLMPARALRTTSATIYGRYQQSSPWSKERRVGCTFRRGHGAANLAECPSCHAGRVIERWALPPRSALAAHRARGRRNARGRAISALRPTSRANTSVRLGPIAPPAPRLRKVSIGATVIRRRPPDLTLTEVVTAPYLKDVRQSAALSRLAPLGWDRRLSVFE